MCCKNQHHCKYESQASRFVMIICCDLVIPTNCITLQQSSCDALVSLMSVQLAHTTFSLDEKGNPFASPLPTLRFSHFLPTRTHHAVFSLGHTLFDPLGLSDLPSKQSQAERICAYTRRSGLLEWLTNATSDAVESAVRKADKPLQATLAMLTGYQVARATDSALDQSDLRLSLLVSQAGSADDTFKSDLQLQLDKWDELEVSKHVDPTYCAILALLATGRLPSTGPSVDWLRQLACALFYASPDVSQALQAYEPTEQEDFSYELIRLFVRLAPTLEHALLPEHFPGHHAVEKELQAWIAHQLIAKVLQFTEFDDKHVSSAKLTVSLAHGLEQAGSWTWAVLVLLHLSDGHARQRAVKEVLFHHADKFNSTTLQALKSFSIPDEWIEQAQAQAAFAKNDKYSAYLHLLRAKLYDQAHTIFTWDLAPEAVLSGDLGLLERLLDPFMGHELACDWSNGGLIYRTYSSALRLQDSLRAGQTAEIARLRQSLPRLLIAMPTFLLKAADKRRTPVREAAVSEILEACTRIYSLINDSSVSQIT